MTTLTHTQCLFLLDVLENMPAQEADAKAVIDPIIDGFRLLCNGGGWTNTDAEQAAEAAMELAQATKSELINTAAMVAEDAARAVCAVDATDAATLATDAAYWAVLLASYAAAYSYEYAEQYPSPSPSARAAEENRQKAVWLSLIKAA